MIIKGLFGKNEDSDKNQRKASVKKFCGICQEAFQKGTDDVRLAHCNDCVKNNRTADAAHWKQVFAAKKVNTLTPDMQKLADKLAANRSLVEGKKMSRAAGESERTERNLGEIRKAQSSLDQTDFGVVKAQIKEMLPSILSELGLSKKINADLLADLIVPIKIASPIADSMAGRSALKSIVHEALEHLNVTREITREASVRPHGTNVSTGKVSLLNEGFGRVSNDYGNRSRSLSQIANDMAEMNQLNDGSNMAAPDSAFAPADGGVHEEMGEQSDPMMMNEDQLGHDPMSETGPSADVAHSEELGDESGVKHLDDAEADAMINGQAPEMPAQEQQEAPEMPNEGVGTYSGGNDNFVPDASEMPEEGAVKRMDQAGPDMATRQVASLKQQKVSKSSLDLFKFAGKITSKLPVQSVKLSSMDRNIIEGHPPINKFAAVYTDRSKLAWNYYLTDNGFLMVSAENAFHSKSLSAFADFVESDNTFAKWASLPEELQEEAPSALESEHEVDDMALPEEAQASVPGGEGTPGFNEIPETVLEPSQDNSMSGGMMNEQDAIFDNSGDDSDPAEVSSLDDEVVDTASEMLPHIEKMFPEESPEEHQEMAITAALELLIKRASKIVKAESAMEVGEDESTPEDVSPNELKEAKLKKKPQQH
jgi:hypothetical protein